MAELKFGSPEWRIHLRRSLAQKKRHGANIGDIESMIKYIEAKGPKKGLKDGRSSRSGSRTYRKQNSRVAGSSGNASSTRKKARTKEEPSARSPEERKVNESGLFGPVQIVRAPR